MLAVHSNTTSNKTATTAADTAAKQSNSYDSSSTADTPIKMERRDSSTSESSLEHLDLGRTPKKLNSHTSATSTPHLSAVACGNKTDVCKDADEATKQLSVPQRTHDSDEMHDYDDDESSDEKPQPPQQQQPSSNSSRTLRHHKRRNSGRLDKRTSVQLEYNVDNPNSLRKKFRFNRSGVEAASNASNNNNNTNESGFVDGSSLSHYLNASAASAAAAQQPQASSPLNSATTSHNSSASSSPHGAGGASASSPESGIGEREDMKYVCPICEVVSATPHEFTNHIRCHNYSSGDMENFTCRICSKVLSSASSLDRHVLVHTGERPFNCRYCHLTFTTNGNMHRHMRTHKQHQHNHHHRRNSHGTAKTNNNNSSSHNSLNNHNSNSNGSNNHTAAAVATANTLTATNPQLSNGNNAESEGVKASVLFGAGAGVGVGAEARAGAADVAAVNGGDNKRLNGVAVGGGVESCESDGDGCSTDSSSAISQRSNHNHMHNNNNNHTHSKNNNSSIKATNNRNNNNNSNHHINNNNNNHNNHNSSNNVTANNFKRKSSDHHFDADDDMSALKRRVKTTINNNNIIVAADDGNETHVATTRDMDESTVSAGVLACPVCNASDFENMLALGAHMDLAHADIPAKCRHCDVIFRSHGQLNVHICAHKLANGPVVPGFKDLTFVDFSSDKFPLIAKSLCEQTLRTAVANQRFECPKCGRAFPCGSALELHVHECLAEALRQQNAFELFLNNNGHNSGAKLRRSCSESSVVGVDADTSDEAQRREQFLRQLYLRNRPLPSPHHSSDAVAENNCDAEDFGDGEPPHLMSQQSHDSKDFADIQSILNMTSSSSTSNFLKNFEQSVNTPSSNYSMDKDEEEAQDAFTAEFRKMKLRGEFPCKLCTAVFPNLRALKGHNRVHLGAVGPTGPFRCNMCPYSICDKAALVRHMRTHNGDRPYECAACNYAFTTKANCERHLRNRHAKTTRDEVKRAIIYHPSEDSACDDSGRKLHMFSSPEFDDDVEFGCQQQVQPKDRSTPVSHLKEMLSANSDSHNPKPLKIQVKRLDQLIDKHTAGGFSDHFDGAPTDAHAHQTPDSTAPIDLSMDVLDLSKKPIAPKSAPGNNPQLQPEEFVVRPTSPPRLKVESPNNEKDLAPNENMDIDLSKSLALSDPYMQFYRSLLFPPLNPFFLQNSFLQPNLSDLQKIAPLMSRMFAGVATGGALPPQMDLPQPPNANIAPPTGLLPQVSPLMADKTPPAYGASPSTNNSNTGLGGMLNKSLSSPTPPPPVTTTINIPRHAHMPPTVLSGGPVKMVIKNGVLMPKQKQRRYRTERPFACEHCSARFTLRSNMERHVKQQHPQFYAQRQRSGHHIMRGRGASSAASMNSITHLQAAFAPNSSMQPNTISEQVKYAILAQQLKARKDTDLLQQALAHGSSSVAATHSMLNPLPALPHSGQQFNFAGQLSSAGTPNGGAVEDDEPKLIIDEDEDEEEEDEDVEEIPDDNEEQELQQQQKDDDDLHETEEQEEHLPEPVVEVRPKTAESANAAVKRTAETILEQAIKAAPSKPEAAAQVPPPANALKTMIAQAEAVGKSLKELASAPFKDESPDLVPVSKLVDNATSNNMTFNNYFRPSNDAVNHMEQSDEEGLVASGSASESNNSGTEDVATAVEPKKKSAYSLAPNRVSCPYCQRMFPWSSSLRRHILTHTGQKPFKCSHCPLLFTTKSNCDRHLLRKHGNIASAMSVYVPTEDVTEPIPVPKSVEEIEQQQRQREEEERKRKAEEAKLERERREKEQRQQQQQQQQQHQQLQLQLQQHQQEQELLLKQLAAAQFGTTNACPKIEASNNTAGSTPASGSSTNSSSELPYKCHLCESSFGERLPCLEHIKVLHAQEFALLLAKGAIDTEVNELSLAPPLTEEEERRAAAAEGNGSGGRGRFPDYSNRKVICAFCLRRFWSTEDLRRHMRTHSGERPFQCEFCLRKFTLKHSMLRHMKKHNGRSYNGAASGDPSAAGNSGSDFSDDEGQTTTSNTATAAAATTPGHNASQLLQSAMRAPKIQELLSKASEWRASRLSSTLGGEQKENIAAEEQCNSQSDLIGNLLGISDQGILNKLLSSADEAAKLLGVEK